MTVNLPSLNHTLPERPVDAMKNKALTPKDDKALKAACAGFESILLKKMLDEMRDTLEGDALFGKSNAINIYQSMYDQHLAEELSQAQSVTGLKEFLYRELKAANLI
ncbi:MAG: flagellar biosynthesis protein FlgJ [Desulfobacterales bacterium]|nr:MAG: flagellar biosynthesis protein FlgJ [Desulfobacterales bacterium]